MCVHYEVAKQERVEAPAEKVEAETARFFEQHKDADKERVRVYVASALVNEAVLEMLEKESAR